MWTYRQCSGVMDAPDGTIAGVGYSGAPGARNNPSKESIPDVGPIPKGWYTIERLECTTDLTMTNCACPDCRQTGQHKHGPFALMLVPDPANVMFGRSGFLIHGDNLVHTASHGCIIMDRSVREKIWQSGDRRLQVTA